MFKVEKFYVGEIPFVIRKSRTGKREVLENLKNNKTLVARNKRLFEKNMMIEDINELGKEVLVFKSYEEYSKSKGSIV